MQKPGWKDIADAIGLAAIVASLVVLILEVRGNTLAIERQAAIDRAMSITEPFFDSGLPAILTKIKAVDGETAPQVLALMQAYDLTHEEATIWERHLWLIWEVLEAEYLFEGSSEELDNHISSLLITRDNRIYLEQALSFRFSDEFRRYVLRLQREAGDWSGSETAQ